MSSEESARLNIGALAAATGVPVETIRTWERRYGFPRSKRNEAGHRIYEVGAVEHLRLIRRALDRGYRPSQLQEQSVGDLRSLLEKSGRRQSYEIPETEVSDWLSDWLAGIKELSTGRLQQQLQAEYSRLPVLEFLEERMAPFLEIVGQKWAAKELSVGEEHLISELVREFLSEHWRRLSNVARGPCMLLAALPDEEHTLGLHMAALVAALADRRVIFLGANTPLDDLISFSRTEDVDALAVSISNYAKPKKTSRVLRELKEKLAADVELIVGGQGAPARFDEGRVFRGHLGEFYEYLSS